MDARLRNFGFLLKELSRRYVLRFEQRAREISLTLPQCKVLVRLEDNEGASQARLAELTDVEPMTMVRILDRMEADGLLERRPDPDDRRARCLYLTLKAKPLLEQIWRVSELTRAETFAGIGRPDRELFMSVLERMHGNLCALNDQPVPQADTASLRQPDSKGGQPGRLRRIRTR
ncbi:MAG: MarR family winged helix-turn-helix transcriptional regulator [Steroidobacteraceae bacterium]